MGRLEYKEKYGWNNKAKECGFTSVGNDSIPMFLNLILTVRVCTYDQLLFKGHLIRTSLDPIYLAFL